MNTYKTKGVCAKEIQYEVKDNKITYLKFYGGCPGNAQGIEKLCIGKQIDEVISLLSGIQCRNNTSCPDQLAQALVSYKKKQ